MITRPVRRCVVLLAPANSVHTQRWAVSLTARQLDVTLISQHDVGDWEPPKTIRLIRLPFVGKTGYFLNALPLRRMLKHLRPTLLHAHYASGYGTMAALARYTPTLLSVWGSDVFDFPYESWIKGRLLRWNLRCADALASTSEVMVQQVLRLAPDLPREICVTPFGVDTQRFAPTQRSTSERLTIGTVKTLADNYGIDTLIRGFALLRSDVELKRSGVSARLRLVLVGEGPKRAELEQLTTELGVAGVTRFVGAVAHEAVPEWLNRLDVYVAASRRESFGVAVIEASACGVPVVVSNAGGLPEVVDEGRSGFVVERNRPDLLADQLKRLVLDVELRRSLGDGGRRLVLERYDWDYCVDRMLSCYERVIAATPARRARVASIERA